MDINYELYRVFYHVAKTLSFSEASKQLFISQSAVSQSIKTLEKKLDQQLFIRSTKKVSLTPAGEVLFKHIEPAMNLIRRGEDELMEGDISSIGQLHIAASDTICRYFLVPYLKTFHRQFPDIQIRVTNATSIGCVELLEQNQVDLIISNYPNMRLSGSAVTKKVCEFQDVFVGNPSYFPFINEPTTLSELTKYPLMTLPKYSTTSEYLHKTFINHQLELLPSIRLSSNDLLIDLAKIGLGIAFVPDICIKRESKDLKVINLEETLPPRLMVAATLPTAPLSAAAQSFLDLLPQVD